MRGRILRRPVAEGVTKMTLEPLFSRCKTMLEFSRQIYKRYRTFTGQKTPNYNTDLELMPSDLWSYRYVIELRF